MLAVAALAAQRGDPVELPRPAPAGARRQAVAALPRTLAEGERVDLNRASADDLAALPGVGPKLAQRIVDERSRRGRFTAVEQLEEVHGIGPKLSARLRAFAEVTQPDQNKSRKYEADTPALK